MSRPAAKTPRPQNRGLAGLAALLGDQTPAPAKPAAGEARPASSATAPYNFVPFCETPLQRYPDRDALPGHDRLDPDLLSGEIRLTLTAETPLFVGGSQQEPGQPRDFFRGADGRYQIPGSTLRGLLRSNLQILGFGLERPGEDLAGYRLYYRLFGQKNNPLKSDLQDQYDRILKGKEGPGDPINVRAGYLCHEGDSYYIQPVAPPLRVPRNSPVGRPFRDQWATEFPVWYRATGQIVTDLQRQTFAGARQGTLLCVGYMNKQNSLYLFRDEPEGEPIQLSRQEVLFYQEDFELRQNQLGGTRATKADPRHWALPDKGCRKAVFFLNRGSAGPAGVTRAGGEAHYNATSFGRSRYLRILFDGGLEDGLPAAHRDRREENTRFLDYPSALLGFAMPGRQGQAYRSRVSVGALAARGDPRPLAPVSMILGPPRPGFFGGYVTPERDPKQPNVNRARHYNSPSFTLRGTKQYWLKPADLAPETNGKDKVASVLRPLPAGTVFAGSVRYQNLHPDELGLLLWALRLAPDCRQNLGLGKPYGYGRVRIQVEGLYEWQPRALLQSFGVQPPTPAPASRLDELESAYRAFAVAQITSQYPAYAQKHFTGKKKASPDKMLEKLPTLAAFFQMKRCIHTAADQRTVAYMDLKQYQKLREPLETVAQHMAKRRAQP